KLLAEQSGNSLHYSPTTKCLVVHRVDGAWFRSAPLERLRLDWRPTRALPTLERMTLVKLYDGRDGEAVYCDTTFCLRQWKANGEWMSTRMISWYDPSASVWRRLRDAVMWRLIRLAMPSDHTRSDS
ncbi:MAG TPA: hypothetical protein VIP11_23565, partial [Gemmatimonadaceae bacterium]